MSVKAAPPDGYTLMLATTSTNAANVHMYKNPGYDPEKDFYGRRHHRLVRHLPRGAGRQPLQDAGRSDRLRQGATRQAQLRLLQRELAGAGRGAGREGRRRMAGRRLQGDRQCLERSLCRRHPLHVRRPHRRRAARSSTRRRGRWPSRCPARSPLYPDVPTLAETFPGFTSTGLPGHRRAEGHAAADPAAAEHADQRGDHLARDQQAPDRGVRAHRRAAHAGTVRRSRTATSAPSGPTTSRSRRSSRSRDSFPRALRWILPSRQGQRVGSTVL